MSKRFSLLLTIAGLQLMIAGHLQNVHAQQPLPERMDWEGIPFGGGSFLQNSRIPTTVLVGSGQTNRTVEMKYSSGYQVGMRLKQNLDEYWAADLEYSFANQPLEFTNLTPQIQSLSLSHSVHDITYNVSYHVFDYWKRFRPYGKIGAGTSLFYIHQSSKDQASALGVPLRDSWKFAFNWGGGLKYSIADQVALTFDARDLITGIPSYGLPPAAQVVNGQFQPGISRSGLMHHGLINFGVAFQWNDWQ